MRTLSSSNLVGESSPNPTTLNLKHRNRRRSKQPFSLEESPLDMIVDQRTIVELLRAPTEGYAEVIVVPPILAEYFELKHSLINMMTSHQFFGLEKDNPHDHIHRFNKLTSTIKYKDVPNLAIKLMLFPFSVAGATLRWLKKEPPRSGPLHSSTIANPKGKLKDITTQSGLILDGHSVPMLPPFINLDEDECADETLTDPKLAEYTIKVPPPLVQKAKPPSLRNYMMLKALLSNKEKLLELANTPLNENCSATILKKLPDILGDLGKYLIPCGFRELKCKALADLANRAIFTPARIARDVFVLVGKFRFLADFVIVDYESDPQEFDDELTLITFPPRNDDLLFDIESDLKEIEYLLNHDPTKEMDSILEDSLDEGNLTDPNNDLADTIPEMFTDKHTLDYSSPPLYDDVDDDLVEHESGNDDVYDDPFDSKEDKIKESKHLIDELDPLDQDKVFNPGILIHENLFEVTIRVTPDKNVKKISIYNASLILEDFNPPLFELPFHKEVLGSETLLSFSFENEEKVSNPVIPTSKAVYTSLLPELSHRGPKDFKVIKILKARWIFFLALMERTSVFWMFCVSISIPHEKLNSGIAQILKTRAGGFILQSLDLRILSFILKIQYSNLIE
nr:reverse transcriptase domain-containing protein [Tanacetum cinerariifolium]